LYHQAAEHINGISPFNILYHYLGSISLKWGGSREIENGGGEIARSSAGAT
jgi:hypothetical protein